MAKILGMEEETNLETEKKMRIDKVEEVEEMVTIGVIEKIEGVAAEIVEERTMGAPEPINLIMEEAVTTADQGKAHEESARRLQANGSLL